MMVSCETDVDHDMVSYETDEMGDEMIDCETDEMVDHEIVKNNLPSHYLSHHLPCHLSNLNGSKAKSINSLYI